MHYKNTRKGILQYFGIKHHEYWAWWLLVLPVWPLWVWYMFRTGNLTWFTAVNPGMEDSGFLGESKMKILDSIPDEYKPLTIFIDYQMSIDIDNPALGFPFIAKPDIGGRGRKIKVINSAAEFQQYHDEVGEDYMIQEMIPYEVELGVFYIRMPFEQKGTIVSLAQKEFLHVVGDGVHTVRQLMKQNFRAAMQIERLDKLIILEEVLKAGEIRILEPIGNHCRGTIFRDRCDRINDQLCEVFDHICTQIDGFYYGRFDLRVTSFEDLIQGKNIRIMELNGLTADAAHIFDPNARLRDALWVQVSNCKKSYRIAKYNLKLGAKTTPAIELYRKGKKGF